MYRFRLSIARLSGVSRPTKLSPRCFIHGQVPPVVANVLETIRNNPNARNVKEFTAMDDNTWNSTVIEISKIPFVAETVSSTTRQKSDHPLVSLFGSVMNNERLVQLLWNAASQSPSILTILGSRRLIRANLPDDKVFEKLALLLNHSTETSTRSELTALFQQTVFQNGKEKEEIEELSTKYVFGILESLSTLESQSHETKSSSCSHVKGEVIAHAMQGLILRGQEDFALDLLNSAMTKGEELFFCFYYFVFLFLLFFFCFFFVLI